MNQIATPQIHQFRSETPHFQTKQDYYSGPFSQRAISDRDYETPYLARGRPKPKNPSLIILHIKLDPKNQKDIKCSLDDDPEILAEEFCEEHRLPRSLVPVVTRMIQEQFTLAASGKSNKGSVMKTSQSNSLVSAPFNEEKAENSRMKGSVERSKFSERDNFGSRDTSGIVGDRNGQKKKQKKPKLITKLNVNIGNGQTRDLLLYEGEDPAMVAVRFQEENGLPEALIGVLVKQLIKSKELYNQRKEGVSEEESVLTKGNNVRENPKQTQMKEYKDYYREEGSQYSNKVNNRENQRENQRENSRGRNQEQPEFSHPNLTNSRLFNNLVEKRNSDENKNAPRKNSDYRSFPDEDRRVSRDEERIEHLPLRINTGANLKPLQVDLSAFRIENEYESIPQEEQRIQKKEAKQIRPNKGYQNYPEEDKVEYREQRQNRIDLIPPKINKTHQDSPDGSEERNADGYNPANSYEKWQQLITEKRKIQQVETENNQPTRGRSPTPGRNNQVYNMALQSLSPKNRKSTKSDTEKSVEKSPNRLDRSKADEVVNRLYSNVKKERHTQNEWEYSPARSSSPMKKKNPRVTLNYRPKQGQKLKKPHNLWAEEFIEGYEPSPRRAMEIMKYEQENKERFTFTPYISEYSRYLADKRNRSLSPIHFKLHAEAEKHKHNRNLLEQIGIEEKCSFQPNVHKYTSQSEAMEKGFLDRLAEREEAKKKRDDEQKEKKEKEERSVPRDSVTGQTLYKPLINRDKYYLLAQKRDHRRIKDALEDKKHTQVIKKKRPEENSFQKTKQVVYEKNPQEEKSLLKISLEKYKMEKQRENSGPLWNVFRKLDGDHDGYISDRHIELSELDPTTLEALIGILEIIEQRELNVDFKGFKKLVEDELGAEEIEIINAHNSDDKYRSEHQNNMAPRMSRDEERSERASERSIPEEFVVRKTQEPEKVTIGNLSKHYSKILGKK